MLFVARLAAVHQALHMAEIESLLTLCDPQAIVQTCKSPFAFIDFTSEASARWFANRSAFLKSLVRLLAKADDLEGLRTVVRSLDLTQYEQASFCFEVDTFGRSLEHIEQVELIDSFDFLPLKGPVKLKHPDIVFCVLINFDSQEFLFGLKLQETSLRAIIDDFSLKKRTYLGTTSMDAELSFVMANVACVQPGHLVYDPFAGTGSLLYAASYLGAFCIGSDIDGRQMRGNTGTLRKGSLAVNLQQYNLHRQVLGGLVFDFSRMPFSLGSIEGLFDAIVTDPPYGVRAGAKKIQKMAHRNIDVSLYGKLYPQMAPYELGDLVFDLLAFAAHALRLEGRLVFWYPVEWRDASQALVRPVMWPANPCLCLLHAVPQKCQRMTRWLLVYSKMQ
jgi:tRNA (guanine10-N2)-methyltransferase